MNRWFPRQQQRRAYNDALLLPPNHTWRASWDDAVHGFQHVVETKQLGRVPQEINKHEYT